ncbi:type IV secretion system protein [Lysobacter firmicutimachus]|uniref:Type IV secretion system protein n=1 Tax=Lysobacter firmicutimachus TaxID=1792846 RepID=A0AAU8MXF2_9GAMM
MDGMQWDAAARAADAWAATAGIGDFVFFRLIDEYFRGEIDRFGLQLMARAMAWASAIALSLVTLWILIAGYRIVTGRSRDSMPALVADLARIAVIVAVATGMSLAGTRLHEFFTHDLDREIHELFTGIEGRTAAQSIDENLAYAQVALDAIDAVQVVEGEQALREEKARALLFAGFGAAGPAMTAAAMLLLYKFGIAVFIGLGPLFVLCLIFDQTRELFRRWLLYGVGTLFSMATLSVVTAMCTKLLSKIAVAFWASKLAAGLPGLDAEGMSTLALQQGGIGLILTIFIVVAPPVSALFFNGTLGQFQAHSAFAGNAAAAARGGAAPVPALPPSASASEQPIAAPAWTPPRVATQPAPRAGGPTP